MCSECSDWLSPLTGSRGDGVRGGEEGGAAGTARERQAALLAMMGAKMEAS